MDLHVAVGGHVPPAPPAPQTRRQLVGAEAPAASRMHDGGAVVPAGTSVEHGAEGEHGGEHTLPGTPLTVAFSSPAEHGPRKGFSYIDLPGEGPGGVGPGGVGPAPDPLKQ